LAVVFELVLVGICRLSVIKLENMQQFGFPLINLLRDGMCALVDVNKIILTGL
jgi:hypothetical protein